MKNNPPLPQYDSLIRKLVRTGIVVGLFACLGIGIGMGYFSRPILPPTAVAGEEMPADSAAGSTPAILGAMVSERRPDGHEWHSMVLTGRYNQDLGGVVEMSLYQESTAILRARFEADARREGWRKLDGAPDVDNRLELWHDDGRMRIVTIDDYSSDLRSVTVFTGKLARRENRGEKGRR